MDNPEIVQLWVLATEHTMRYIIIINSALANMTRAMPNMLNVHYKSTVVINYSKIFLGLSGLPKLFFFFFLNFDPAW